MTAYNELSPQSKVWIYQSDRQFTEAETNRINNELSQFADRWVAHNNALKSFAQVYYDLFIVLIVDEAQYAASGCSIDSSVHFLKNLEKKYNLDLFNRLNIAYKNDSGEIDILHKDQVEQALENGIISEKSIIFNNLVSTKSAFENNWQIPLKASWVAHLV